MHVRPFHIFHQTNYGRTDEGCVEKVKAVYESVNLRQLYAEYEEQSYQNIGKLIKTHGSKLRGQEEAACTHVFWPMQPLQ